VDLAGLRFEQMLPHRNSVIPNFVVVNQIRKNDSCAVSQHIKDNRYSSLNDTAALRCKAAT